MAVNIGQTPDSGFDDPIGLLGDCHRRIERFMGVLETLAQRTSTRALTRDERDAVDVILRYFREAAPKHTQDEEDSLFPRLRSHGSNGAKLVLSKIKSLEREHADANVWHHEVDNLGRRWASLGVLEPQEFERLRDLLFQLHRLYREHIALEDKEIFPAARTILTQQELTEIGQEMARRRGLA
jgi:hemerythrin-like domain-containing protein